MEKIKFIPDGEAEAVEFFVIEQTRLRGVNYLLNVGPDALGRIPAPAADILHQVGRG